jgi:hypothetical protein
MKNCHQPLLVHSLMMSDYYLISNKNNGREDESVVLNDPDYWSRKIQEKFQGYEK